VSESCGYPHALVKRHLVQAINEKNHTLRFLSGQPSRAELLHELEEFGCRARPTKREEQR
jgi:hypothetical protein